MALVLPSRPPVPRIEAARLQMEEVPVRARCRAAGQDRYEPAQPAERDGCRKAYSLTNKVLQLCNGWMMEATRANGSPAILFVDPKTQTLIDVDFRES